MYRNVHYWTCCFYCKKRVRGGIQGIRAHLRGCPYIREVRTYAFKGVSYLVDAGPTTLEFFDTIFKRFTLEDGEAFRYILESFKKKKNNKLRYSFEVVPIEPAKS